MGRRLVSLWSRRRGRDEEINKKKTKKKERKKREVDLFFMFPMIMYNSKFEFKYLRVLDI